MQKRKLLCLAFCIFMFNLASSQNAYKEFKWGMSLEQTETICHDIQKYVKTDAYSSNFDRIDFFAVGAYLNCTIGDNLYSPYTPGDSDEEYISEKNQIALHFEENKLRCIKIKNTYNVSVDDLIEKYGKPFIREEDENDKDYLFINDKYKFILFVKSLKWGDRLYYLDRKWFTDFYDGYIKSMRKEHQDNINKILD